MARMSPRFAGALVAVLLLLGCRHLDHQYAEAVDDLVFRKAGKADAIREFGKPVSSSTEAGKETVVFIPIAKSSSKTVSKVVNGVETSETTTVGKPGKFKVTMTFVGGVATGGTVSPNR
jgi:hypothetical protein